MIFIFFRERRRRFVRIVGIVQVDPNEMRSGAVFTKPVFSVRHDFHSATFDPSPARFGFAIGALAIVLGEVVVEIEAAIEAGGERIAVENYSSDERGGSVALPLQQLCGGDMLR